MKSVARFAAFVVLGTASALASQGASAQAKPKPKAPPVAKPPAKNETKGQGQLVGVNGQFGTIYSLKSHINFTILSAKYTIEPFISYTKMRAKSDKKILVLDVAIKNNTPEDRFVDGGGFITLVDSKGQLYTEGEYSLKSLNGKEGSFNLKPGQGLGQAALKDPLQYGMIIPSNARIVKIMVNQGREGKNEEVIRYYVAGATKDEAGEAGDPKNSVAPLPDNVRSAEDKSGATPMAEGKGTAGEYVPSGHFNLRLDKLEYSSENIMGNPPDEGKRFVIATVTAKLLIPAELTMFEITGGDTPLHSIVSADNERNAPTLFLKAKRDETAEYDFKQGSEYTFRIVFSLPKDTTAKKLILGVAEGPIWAYDVSKTPAK